MTTFFKNIYENKPYFVKIETALSRIRLGASKPLIDDIRQTLDKSRSNAKKTMLPSVLFSGEFSGRNDSDLKRHSGFLVLDFDGVYDVNDKKEKLKKYSFIYSAWVSPSGTGVKALVKIKHPDKHRQHFKALKEIFNDLDNSGINLARVCYESYDPEIWINENAIAFDKTKEERESFVNTIKSSSEDFNKILTWLTNRGDAFRTGERNLFMYKLAAACCRFGITESECLSLSSQSFLMQDDSFTMKEAERAIKSAYKKNDFGTAEFEKDYVIDKETKREIELNADIYNLDIKPKDVIFGLDVKSLAVEIYRNGYESAESTGSGEIDEYFKFKKGEITLISGIGNYGKSNFVKYLMVLSVVKFKRKFGIFTPEEMPAHEFYHDLTEIYLGAYCTPNNKHRPSESEYLQAYDIISNHIFCIYPETIMPSPEYIKEKFLELIIKEKIFCCIIDPFNQLANDYTKGGGNTAKYLETFLSDCSRFAITNSVNFLIVAHPHKLQKDSGGNYPCPDVFEIADGAMWNNKMDNILIYHRPNHQLEPDSSLCELHTKKIRRQKMVGKKGILVFELEKRKRRYLFRGVDPLQTNDEKNKENIINFENEAPF